jgi:hypothetical protein
MAIPVPSSEDLFGSVISAYSRAEALADGVLVSAMEGDLGAVTREYFTVPVAMTAAVFALLESAVGSLHQSVGAWHAICLALSLAVARLPGSSSQPELLFNLDRRGRQESRTLKAVIAPGDRGEPCLTLMLPGED